MEYMHSTAVPPPEVTTEYTMVTNGVLLRCYVELVEDTPLLVDGLTIEWFNQSDGSSLGKRSGTAIGINDDDGRRQFAITLLNPQRTSYAGVYTCQVSLSSENMSIALQQPVTNVMHTVNITSKFLLLLMLFFVVVFLYLLVPTPSVTIIAPSDPLYVGDSLTLQCQVEISDAVNTPVDVSYTWKKSREPLSSNVSITISNNGSYSCEAMVTPSGSTEFILPSGVGKNTTVVVFQGSAAHGMIM